jgi:hypothetical protein
VAVVLGVLGLCGLALVAVLIAAVTFLGTTSEPTFVSVGSGPITPVGPGSSPDDRPSARMVHALDAALGAGDWSLHAEEAFPLPHPGPCAPDGWLTGAIDHHQGTFGRRSTHKPYALVVSVVVYESSRLAADEAERAHREEHQRCAALRHQEDFGTTPVVTALADDPAAPGAAYEVAETAGGPAGYDVTVVVGVVRAHLAVCVCADADVEAQRELARDVAATLAVEQGLPVPG